MRLLFAGLVVSIVLEPDFGVGTWGWGLLPWNSDSA